MFGREAQGGFKVLVQQLMNRLRGAVQFKIFRGRLFASPAPALDPPFATAE
jgi:hypothetical protein